MISNKCLLHFAIALWWGFDKLRVFTWITSSFMNSINDQEVKNVVRKWSTEYIKQFSFIHICKIFSDCFKQKNASLPKPVDRFYQLHFQISINTSNTAWWYRECLFNILILRTVFIHKIISFIFCRKYYNFTAFGWFLCAWFIRLQWMKKTFCISPWWWGKGDNPGAPLQKPGKL